MPRKNSSDHASIAGEIVAAYVSNNSVPASALPDLIRTMHNAVATLAVGGGIRSEAAAVTEKPTAAQIRKSLRDDRLVSFIDGRAYKTLKRHLTSKGMTPESYRERFGLPRDYPMVAPSYAEMRSELARSIGLGQVGGQSKRAGRSSKAA